MQVYKLLCQELGTRPEDERLLRALELSCPRPAPRSVGFLQAATFALLAFAALAVAARFFA